MILCIIYCIGVVFVVIFSAFKMTSSSSPILPSNDVGPVGTLLFFSLLMIVCPISTFFIVRSTLVHFATDMLTSSIAAAVCSILAVHGVVAMFVYKAYHEKDDGPSPALVDKDSKVPQKID